MAFPAYLESVYALLDWYWMWKKRVIMPDAATSVSMWWMQSKIVARVRSPRPIGTGWQRIKAPFLCTLIIRYMDLVHYLCSDKLCVLNLEFCTPSES